jgi:eukaryotic-like serine/threonine-protein kinase
MDPFLGKLIAGRNVLEVYDVGETDDGDLYLSMEPLPERVLRGELADGPLSLRRAIAIVTQLADAVGRAHKNGVIHLDLRPEKVFLGAIVGERDFVKLGGFELSFIERDPPLPSRGTVSSTPARFESVAELLSALRGAT